MPVDSKSHTTTGCLQKTRVKSAEGKWIPLKSPADNCQRRAKTPGANVIDKKLSLN